MQMTDQVFIALSSDKQAAGPSRYILGSVKGCLSRSRMVMGGQGGQVKSR